MFDSITLQTRWFDSGLQGMEIRRNISISGPREDIRGIRVTHGLRRDGFSVRRFGDTVFCPKSLHTFARHSYFGKD
jgi:hypothetical protein